MEETSTTTQSNTYMKVLLPIIGVIAIAALGYLVLRPMSSDTATAPGTAQEQGNTPTTETQTGTQMRDGIYTTIGNYISPGGQEELGVTLTLSNGVITDAEVEVMATRPISKAMQEDFAANYKTSVVGKNISDLQLGKISGSSLSPQGFNDALEKIKQQAQS